eukprot:15453259-Alexandrium_andersonii.AAC.1
MFKELEHATSSGVELAGIPPPLRSSGAAHPEAAALQALNGAGGPAANAVAFRAEPAAEALVGGRPERELFSAAFELLSA